MGTCNNEVDYVVTFETVSGVEVEKAFVVIDMRQLFDEVILYSEANNLRFTAIQRLNNLTRP